MWITPWKVCKNAKILDKNDKKVMHILCAKKMHQMCKYIVKNCGSCG